MSTSPGQTLFCRLAETHAPAATILIRVAVGVSYLDARLTSSKTRHDA